MFIVLIQNNNLVGLPDGFTITLSSESGFKTFLKVILSNKFL